MSSTEFQNCKVVLADDHSVFRLGLRALLKREGIEVVGEAADGAEALRLACSVHPDVVVMDLSMPVMNGHQLIAAVRAEPKLADLPVILMADTWGRPLPVIEDAIVLGKPILLAELFGHVERAAAARGKPRRKP